MDSISHYRIVRKLGEGGMGVVYAAEDERLGRSVALKLIQKDADSSAKARFWQEARAAARVNHPNICQIYEIGEHEDELFVAMELLEGESLSSRLARGAMAVNESIDTMLDVLDALDSLHQRQIVHRDLKPSNIFLTPRGVKLLDFGLALPLDRADLRLTMPGTILGTPRYMAPEQWEGKKPSPAADLFSCGAVLYEMLTARPAFRGESMLTLCHSIANEQPPPLTGGAEVQSLDRIIHQALAKSSAERFQSAAAMREALLAAKRPDEETVRLARIDTVKRLIVLPFRLLRPDSEIEFLNFSLPDAITTSLCGIPSLTVRSSRVAARWTDVDPDPKVLAKEAEVDVALLGTLMRAGEQVRLKTQLIETPAGTVLWSKTLQVPMGDIFQLEDELRDRVLESLAITLSEKEHEDLDRGAARSGHAYELFLRANQLGFSAGSGSKLIRARDLYRASLEEDPGFAPAWARLGRVYRIMAKYDHGDAREYERLAEEAFERALSLHPDLPIAHNYYTFLEVERGRAPEAMVRLLDHLQRRPTDPELYAGLVVACRFCGLTEASIAADQRAKRLDPTIRTSIHYTYLMSGDLERAIEADTDEIQAIRATSLWELGRADEARVLMKPEVVETDYNAKIFFAALEGNLEESKRYAQRLVDSGFRDPEGFYFTALFLMVAGADDLALTFLRRSVDGSFCAHGMMERHFRGSLLWDRPEFQQMLEESRSRHQKALSMFVAAGGGRL